LEDHPLVVPLVKELALALKQQLASVPLAAKIDSGMASGSGIQVGIVVTRPGIEGNVVANKQERCPASKVTPNSQDAFCELQPPAELKHGIVQDTGGREEP
jgi:hypothetical protein